MENSQWQSRGERERAFLEGEGAIEGGEEAIEGGEEAIERERAIGVKEGGAIEGEGDDEGEGGEGGAIEKGARERE